MLSAKLPKILKFFFLLTFLMAAVGLSSAQQALELPAAPDGTTSTAAPRYTSFYIRTANTIHPNDNADRISMLNMVTEYGKDGVYIFKFKNTVTGVVQSFTIPYGNLYYGLNSERYFSLVETKILAQLSNRTTYVIWGVFKANDGEMIASGKVKAYVVKAAPVTLTYPYNGSSLYLTNFTWQEDPASTSYELRLWDVATGQLLKKVTLNATSCNGTCNLPFTREAFSIVSGKVYRWQVTSIGFDGSRANSVKWKFNTNN